MIDPRSNPADSTVDTTNDPCGPHPEPTWAEVFLSRKLTKFENVIGFVLLFGISCGLVVLLFGVIVSLFTFIGPIAFIVGGFLLCKNVFKK